MFVDKSRLYDLKQLEAAIKDPSKPERMKWNWRRQHSKILKQLRDPKLANMRERLVKAHIADDRREIWKISNQIREYLHEELMEEGTAA